jgi:hypothetical protein
VLNAGARHWTDVLCHHEKCNKRVAHNSYTNQISLVVTEHITQLQMNIKDTKVLARMIGCMDCLVKDPRRPSCPPQQLSTGI